LSFGYFLYNSLVSAFLPPVVCAAALKGRLKGRWRERLGLFLPEIPGDGPRIWLHAVSVGEMQVAVALAKALNNRRPDANLWISTSTDTGRSAAQSVMPDYPVVTFPLDAYGAPARAIERLNPDLIILLETELWPNFLLSAKRAGVKLMLANGRISVRSVKGYRRVAFFFREVLSCFDRLAMIGAEDAERIRSLGADPERITVVGSAKFDLLTMRADRGRVDELRQALGIKGRRVLAAGSTRNGEERIILDVFGNLRREFPDLHLILAPRHVGRARDVEALIHARKFSCRRRSAETHGNGTTPDITLVDVMGELLYLYGLADAAFIGASLVPLGGQNPLEASVWGVPVLFGPSMDDFRGPRDMLLACGGGVVVGNPEQLERELRSLLLDPRKARERGTAGRKALEAHEGAAGRLVELAIDLLPMDKNVRV
jgi:3-deoxy-D-manno-octulosonic-acid transferase